MRDQWRCLELAAGLILWAASIGYSQTAPNAGEEVTLKGALQCNGICLADPKTDDHVIVMVAVDGSPQIAAQVKRILDEFYPDAGLDGDAAEKLNDQFDKQLKYFISPDSPAAMPDDMPKPGPKHYCHSASPYAATGTIYEKDGKKWIRVTKYQALGLKGLKYPDKLMMPDKPFAMPDKTPLALPISGTLTLNCIKAPPGKVFMGEMEFVATRYIEQFPHMVTLTKPVYVSEIPITQEIWQAVMGSNPSKTKGDKLPVENPSTADIQKFCQAMSEKTGKTVRLPTGAEWEYISRVGTSNPGFPDKYRDQGSFREEGRKAPLPVKSKQPNAWGFYDLFSPWWEVTGDRAMYPAHKAETDPHYPLAKDGMHMLLGVTGENWTITEREFEQWSGYTSKKFRIAVEVEDVPTATGR